MRISFILFSILYLIGYVFAKDFGESYRVLIITGKDVKPVRLTIEGFFSEYSREMCKVISVEAVSSEMLKVSDVVVALTSEAAFYVKQNSTKDKVNVYALVLMPDVLGLMKNFVGFSIYPDFEQVFRDFKSRYPTVKRVGLLYNTMNYAVDFAYQSLKKNSLQAIHLKIDNFNFRNIGKNLGNVDAVYFFSDAMVLDEENLLFLIKSIKSQNKIIISSHKVLLDYGVDIVYVLDYFELGRMIALYVKEGIVKQAESIGRIFFPSKFNVIEKT
ncbi:MAG: hypothetical protein ABDH21_01915 [bacterium]